jgi:uncharacterized protein (DUF1499 family)
MTTAPLSRLAPCPRTPNCVSTLAPPGPQHMDPIPYQGARETARQRLFSTLRGMERTKVVVETEDYIHAECRSRIFRFVDDVEMVLDDTAKLIHFRSASRLGHGDHGVNRKRMERIRNGFLSQR